MKSVAGGKAAAAPGSVAEGQKVIDAAVKAFGTVHVLINNAGIIRMSPSNPHYPTGQREY